MPERGFYVDSELLHPDIRIYRRAGGKRGRFSYRLRIDGNYIVESARTTDRDEAAAIAQAAYKEARKRAERGLPLRSVRFDVVVAEFLRQEAQHFPAQKRRKYEQIIGKHLLPCFGAKDASDIKSSDVRSYTRARKASRPAPAASTLNSEFAVLRAIFKFGDERGYVAKSDWPTIENQSLRDQEPRPGFTAAEFEKMVEAAYLRFREARRAAVRRYLARGGDQDDDGSHLIPEQWRGDPLAWHRYLLVQFVILMGSTGMRPSTLLGLTWGHVERREQEGDVILHASTRKGGKRRRVGVVPTTIAQHAIQMLWDLYEAPPPSNARLFPVKELKKSFHGLLVATDLLYDADGRKRTIYSLRHFYITYMLQNGATTAMVAANTLTSEAMITKYYNHLEPTMVADHLTLKGINNIFSFGR